MIGFIVPKISSRRVSQTCYARRSNKNRDWFKDDEDNKNLDKYGSYLLFESNMIDTHGKGAPISLHDVRDAMECCCMIKNDRMRYDCYHQFGVNGKMAEKYFKYVERMERQYEKSEEHIKTKKHIRPYKNDGKSLRKWFHFNIFDDE